MGVFSLRRLALISGVLALPLAFHLYSPIPETTGSPWLLYTHIAAFKMAGLISSAASYIPALNQLDVLRYLLELFFTDSYTQSDPTLQVTETTFDGVPVKIFRPKAARSSSPALVYIHGGGWTVSSANSYSTVTGHMARTYNVIVVSIDYRLAPENPYPVPFEDCLKATLHVLHNGASYGINTKRLALAGDSAGGNLAAAVALRLRDENLTDIPKIKFQVLIYPAVQAFDFNTFSYQHYANTGELTKANMVGLWMNYLGYPELMEKFPEFLANNHTSPLLKKSKFASYLKHSGLPAEFRSPTFKSVSTTSGCEAISHKIETTLLDPYFAPLMAHDLADLPPAYVIVAENDPLRDDGLLYAERLKKAGTPTQVDYHKTASHGFCWLAPIDMFNFPEGLQAYESLGKYVRDNL